ncbi:hypothetical protein [Fibrella forsythiae]|uniref:Uncharacterized protein n=1 Tax=Fibrella forsythiae TaxID=2817061 RepID=A0ABS3JT38_9BACT|nr:hypothetical protein [Fibrella forsythiae]MBO0952561.1 hypothetical protein [Fibrella forsythiae]
MDVRPLTEPEGPAPEQIGKALERGLTYLQNHQYPNGEFCCYIAADKLMQGPCVPDHTVLPTAAIASALLALADHPKAVAILTRTIPFFDYQMMRGGVVNFFALRNPLFQLNPPDADSTACVAAFLDAWGVIYPRNSVRALLLANQRGGAGIGNWFVLRPRLMRQRTYWRTGLRALKAPLASWRFWQQHGYSRNDRGGVANANVLHYLSVDGSSLHILDYLVALVRNRKETDRDPRYRTPITFYYALGRCYRANPTPFEGVRSLVLERLMTFRQPNGGFGESLLETAQALSALSAWGGKPEIIRQAANVLLAGQQYYGEWPRALHFYASLGSPLGWGSEELTTGFCLEAIMAYQRWEQQEMANT